VGAEDDGAPFAAEVEAYAREALRTHAHAWEMEVVEAPLQEGRTALPQLDEDTSAVIVAQPNFLGAVEDLAAVARAAHDAGALCIASCDPLPLALLRSPGECGVDIAVGEGQTLGNRLDFGGPSFGFFAATEALIRRIPGRIAGETRDLDGKRGFVLTLQTREQHIRREKATSNITTNQTLLAVAGLVYLSWLGPDGLRDVGRACLSLAEHAKGRLGLPLAFDRPTFQEFAIRTGRPAGEVIRAARKLGVHPGYALGRDYEGMENVLLVCLTEKRSAADIDRLAEVLAEVGAVAA